MANKFNLPDIAYVKVRSTKEIVLVKFGEQGYYPLREDIKDKIIDELNEEIGVSKEVSKAMEFGSMFGWDLPGCNPEIYKGRC